MAIRTWSGQSSGDNTDWSDADNWIEGIVPIDGDSIYFSPLSQQGPEDNAPSITVAVFDTTGATGFQAILGDITAGITIQAGGILNFVNASFWNGDASQAAICNFVGGGQSNASCQIGGIITVSGGFNLGGNLNGNNATFRDGSLYGGNGLSVGGGGALEFYDSSECHGQAGSATMHDSSFFDGSASQLNGDLTLLDNSRGAPISSGTVNGQIFMEATAQCFCAGVPMQPLDPSSPSANQVLAGINFGYFGSKIGTSQPVLIRAGIF